MQPLIKLEGVSKIYKSGKLEVPALLDIDLEIKKGEMVAVTGPSGSGKSTLMNIIGLLDRPTKGKYILNGEEIKMSMPDRTLAKLRSRNIGFVFQSFHLLPRATALENVLLPSFYNKDLSGKKAKQKTLEVLDQVGLSKRIKHKPSELSGGEKQRVAIARSLVNDPDLLLADEPTGNLDSKSGMEIIKILKRLEEHKGKTVIVITHDEGITKECPRVIKLFDGRIKN